MKKSNVLAMAMASLTCVAHAQTERELGSHEHGAAQLNIAIDGDTLVIELESPWDNLVGFEHAPSTDEQQMLVDDAMALLNEPQLLFSLANAECATLEPFIDSSMGGEPSHDEHHSHDDHDDHDSHGSDGHDDHDKHGSDGHDDHDSHGSDEHDDHDSLAIYAFECENLAELSTIGVEIFDQWSGFEELDVQVIGPGGQTAVELTAAQTDIDLSAVQ